MQPDREAPIISRTSKPALVRMGVRILRLQIILPYSRLIRDDGDNLFMTSGKQGV